jgi:predicted aconitase
VRGQHLAWTESSAIAYTNSVIGSRTNIEGLHSAFASAITGKTPLWGMHLDENRLGNVVVDVQVDMEDLREWCLLGYYVAGQVGLDIPIYKNISRVPDLTRFMAISAAGISSGSIVMHHILGVTPEAPTLEAAGGNRKGVWNLRFGEGERREAYEKLNRSRKEEVDIVALGCPHMSLEGLQKVAGMLEGKRVSPGTKLYITTNTMIRAMARIQGLEEVIKRAGGLILVDSCCLVLDAEPDQVFATNSAKYGHYAPGATGLKNTWFGSTEECVQAALTGKWRGDLS